jgi:hypothetical protein
LNVHPTEINWNDPAARVRLIERIGPEAYSAAQQRHFQTSAVAIVNGYPIRPVPSRFGRLFAVHGTDAAFGTLLAAEEHARSLPAA